MPPSGMHHTVLSRLEEEGGLSAVMLGAHRDETRALSERIVGRTSQTSQT